MKVQLHLHTSRYSFCAVESPTRMLAELCRLRYDAVFLTEHDALWSQPELKELREQFPQIAIYPGLERSVQGQHLLILGAQDPTFLEIDDMQEILSLARRQDLPTILAHPFRWQGGDAVLRSGLELPDAIELKTCNQQGPALLSAAAGAGALSLPTVNADDAHSLDMLGQYWIRTREDFSTPQELRQILVTGAYDRCEAGA
jgi:hypothetical protein